MRERVRSGSPVRPSLVPCVQVPCAQVPCVPVVRQLVMRQLVRPRRDREVRR